MCTETLSHYLRGTKVKREEDRLPDCRGHRDEGRSQREERSGGREHHSDRHGGRGEERERSSRRSHDRDPDRSREGSAGRGERRRVVNSPCAGHVFPAENIHAMASRLQASDSHVLH